MERCKKYVTKRDLFKVDKKKKKKKGNMAAAGGWLAAWAGGRSEGGGGLSTAQLAPGRPHPQILTASHSSIRFGGFRVLGLCFGTDVGSAAGSLPGVEAGAGRAWLLG